MVSREDVEYQTAMRKYDASFMSNAKWLRLFRAIADSGILIDRARWHFVDSEHAIWQSFPSEGDLLPTRFSDGKFFPVEYKWIESVFIPHSYKPTVGVGYERKQDTSSFIEALASIGQFPIERSTDGINITAYHRRSPG